MALWKRNSKGRLIGYGSGGLPIHEMSNVRTFLKGGGWCAGGLASGEPLIVDTDVLDVSWSEAQAKVVRLIELALEVFHWPPPYHEALEGLRDQIRSAPAGTGIEETVGSPGDSMFYWVLPTAEAARRNVQVESMYTQGNRAWLERAPVPS